MSRKVPPQLRRLVWEKYMKDPNKSSGPCFVCGTNIHLLQFECGHVISYADGGPLTVENLRPICGSCNKSMGAKNLYEYKEVFFTSEKRVKKKKSVDEITLGVVKLSLEPVPTLRIESLMGCQHVLLRGKRKGQKCGRQIYKNRYCQEHAT